MTDDPGAPPAPRSVLDPASVLVPAGDGYDWDVPPGWAQGRGAFGGLVLAGLLRAAAATAPRPDGGSAAPRALRALSAQIVAPLPVGPARVTAAPVRTGSAVTTVSASVWSVGGSTGDGSMGGGSMGGGEPVARATAVYGAARDLQPPLADWARECPPMPSVPSWEAVPVVPLGAPVAPEFLQHVRMRPISGLPMTGRAEDVVGWVRFAADPGAVDPQGAGPGAGPGTSDPDRAVAYDAIGLVALVDVGWPTALVRLTAPRPMATLTFDAAVVTDPATLDPAQPLLYRGSAVAGGDGYLLERRELWSPDGRLVVHNVQTMVVIR